MTDANRRFSIGHPAPDRLRVSHWLLGMGLLGGPLAWLVEICATTALSGLACSAGDGPVTPMLDMADGIYGALIAVNVAALILTVLAFGASYRAFRATAHRENDSPEDVTESGEGRTRLLAVWGIGLSILFFVATAVNTISAFWFGLCG
ncbi:hypothetical protein [Consotaella aegiceratis]|uniref:hypothetical protein n=1 Tax=Consotaella aegiceratis TaxID=3097961 RepID=UPI002F3F3F0A